MKRTRAALWRARAAVVAMPGQAARVIEVSD
jgi:hypothetical protein